MVGVAAILKIAVPLLVVITTFPLIGAGEGITKPTEVPSEFDLNEVILTPP